jgi:phosphoenolpyruvate synthase/pyruvate phosphate dikinase
MKISASTVPDILWFGEDSCCDPAQVGGKAAHFSRLATDYLVPPGFCLTAAAFTRRILPTPRCQRRLPRRSPLPTKTSPAVAG